MASDNNRLKINEIFFSLQGESSKVGLPTVFVRLTGCPLRCSYCDTEYAFTGGQWMTFEEIFEAIAGYDTRYITVTGGEPLAQPQCIDLLKELCDRGYEVSLETSGALDISAVDARVCRVMDLKTPGSGEEDKNRFENIQYLSQIDEVKFVICSEDDYSWSKSIIEKYELSKKCTVLISPSQGEQDATTLADWVLRDALPVRFQIQLHKYLWGDERAK